MSENKYILVINPGSTSTKIAMFLGEECVRSENLSHSADEVKKYSHISQQKDMRTEVIYSWLKKNGYSLEDLEAVVGRGGLLRPMPGGTYKITFKMLDDLIVGFQGQHASNLGGVIAFEIAEKSGIPSYIVDPVAVDEVDDVTRISGMEDITRRSLVHALNIKAVTRRVCKKNKLDFDKSNFVVAHIGGGITVAPVKGGRIIDCNNANEDGPFSPERSGGLPIGDLVKLAFSKEYTLQELKNKITREGGLVAYLGTNDGREVDKLIDSGDEKAEFILKAMAYQISKEIGGMSTALCGKIDAIILTGGIAYNKRVTNWITESVKFIAPVELVPGEDEMLALAQGALRVLRGEEVPKIYDEEVSFN
ncbi:MAG: butyrate kinase [Clostridium sp.]|uniref:butyrate kinase n=1 Tax=Clostridium sp. TaxID=1506 RepID=UPI00305AA1AC